MEKREITRLSNIDLLKIVDGKRTYFGGNQSWFKKYVQVSGGCGSTAAANILVYLARSDEKYSTLFNKKMTLPNYLEFMELIYEYVKPAEIYSAIEKKDIKKVFGHIIPPSLGVHSWKIIAKGIRKYGKTFGIDISYKLPKRKSYEGILEFIKEGLNKDKPVAILNMFSPVDMFYELPLTKSIKTVDYKLHWVTIIGLIEDHKLGKVTLETLTWGGKAEINLYDLWRINRKKVLFPLRVVYFE